MSSPNKAVPDYNDADYRQFLVNAAPSPPVTSMKQDEQEESLLANVVVGDKQQDMSQSASITDWTPSDQSGITVKTEPGTSDQGWSEGQFLHDQGQYTVLENGNHNGVEYNAQNFQTGQNMQYQQYEVSEYGDMPFPNTYLQPGMSWQQSFEFHDQQQQQHRQWISQNADSSGTVKTDRDQDQWQQQSDSQYWNNQYEYNQNGNQNQYMQSSNSQQQYYHQDSSQHNQYMQCQASMSQPAMSGSHGDMAREYSLPCVSSEQNKDADYNSLDFTTLRNMLENKEMSAPSPDIIVPQRYDSNQPSSSGMQMQTPLQDMDMSNVSIEQVFGNYSATPGYSDQQEYMQQRFGNRADTKHESLVPGIPSELCYDASGQEQQEMFTLEPTAPNLNANYGNYMEDPQPRDHPIMPLYQLNGVSGINFPEEMRNDQEFKASNELYKLSHDTAEAMNELTREVATIPYGSPAFKENRCKERNDELKGRISYLRLNSRICNNFVKFHVTPKTNAKSMKLCNMAWDALKTPERPTTEQVKYNLKVYDAVCSGDRFNLSSLVEEFLTSVMPEAWEGMNEKLKKGFVPDPNTDASKKTPRTKPQKRKIGRPRKIPGETKQKKKTAPKNALIPIPEEETAIPEDPVVVKIEAQTD
ncbi:unnamed protein product [Oikopleura dioica]|uniref:Uncharacterized protein n=1 Tax=Oikopleura dioica TaxID=34765 RepID=E4XVE2_OIKDI|nr:unnamed protein product [Oikopleura dioica]